VFVKAFVTAYGKPPLDVALHFYEGLGRVAKSLDEGDLMLAMMKAIFLGFPEIEPEGMAKLALCELGKINPDHDAGNGRATGLGGAVKSIPAASAEAAQQARAFEMALSGEMEGRGKSYRVASAETLIKALTNAYGPLPDELLVYLAGGIGKAVKSLDNDELEKFNPWHDLLGMFTDADHAVSDAIVGEANAGEAPKTAPKKQTAKDPNVGPHDLSHSEAKKLVAQNNKSGVPDSVIMAVAYKESRFDPTADNGIPGNSATGLMQVTAPALEDFNTARQREEKESYTNEDLKDPAKNIEVGSWYLQNRIEKAKRVLGPGKEFDFYVREGLKFYKTKDQLYADQVLAAAKLYDKAKSDEEKMAALRGLHKQPKSHKVNVPNK
jgi:soluble lytic murein transglycosylase-like protein